MNKIDALKIKLHDLLIEKFGDVKPWELSDIITEAKEVGINEKQFNKLLVEVDQSINWEAIRKLKDESIIKAEELKLLAKEKSGKAQSADVTLAFLIQHFAEDNVLSSDEVKVYFETSDTLKLLEQTSAKLIEDFIKANNFVPLTIPKGNTLRQMLQSTEWIKSDSPITQPKVIKREAFNVKLENDHIMCPNCKRATLEKDLKYCTKCGYELKRVYKPDNVCPKCTAVLKNPYLKFCTQCGLDLTTPFVESKICPKCKNAIKKKDLKFCTQCGFDLFSTIKNLKDLPK
jgi:hypothetical protein